MERRKFILNMVGLGTMVSIDPILLKAKIANHPLFISSTLKKGTMVEWNAHLFSANITKYPFHPNATYTPDLSHGAEDPLVDYLQYLDANGIDKAVVVQPEPYGDDHKLILDCLKRSESRLKGTSLFYPKDVSAPKKLAKLVKENPDIVSTRFHAHRGKETYLDTFADDGVRALWRQAVELDIIIELHIGPNYGRQVSDAIKAFPGCKVIIDHLAEPHMGDAVEYADILDLANYPNVFMKFSGLEHIAGDNPDFLSARSFTSWVIEAFGPDRMVMGGVTAATVDKHMAEYSESDRAKVTGGNLLKLLNWN